MARERRRPESTASPLQSLALTTVSVYVPAGTASNEKLPSSAERAVREPWAPEQRHVARCNGAALGIDHASRSGPRCVLRSRRGGEQKYSTSRGERTITTSHDSASASARGPSAATRIGLGGRPDGRRSSAHFLSSQKVDRRTPWVGLLTRKERIARLHDSRAASPSPAVSRVAIEATRLHSQWRDRAGFAPASLLCPCGHPRRRRDASTSTVGGRSDRFADLASVDEHMQPSGQRMPADCRSHTVDLFHQRPRSAPPTACHAP